MSISQARCQAPRASISPNQGPGGQTGLDPCSSRETYIFHVQGKFILGKRCEVEFFQSEKLWRSVSTILGEPAKQTATHSTFWAAEFLTFLEQKVETIRLTQLVRRHQSSHQRTAHSLHARSSLFRNLIGSAPSKSCELDPAPTFLIKEFLDTLLPLLTRLCNVSLQEGWLPSSQTTAIVTSALKKHGLDPTDMKNYRPISNLSFMSKVVERIVVRQLLQYLDANGQFSRNFSLDLEDIILRNLPCFLYCPTFSPQSTMNGSRYLPSSGVVADVSAAFDTVDQAWSRSWLVNVYKGKGDAWNVAHTEESSW